MDQTELEAISMDSGLFFSGGSQEFDEYTQVVQDPCPSLSSSFLTVDTSSFGHDLERRSSMCSTSPDSFASSTASVPSPVTPIGPMSMLAYPTESWLKMNGSAWMNQNNDPFWTGSDATSMSTCLMSNMVEDDSTLQYQQGYFYPFMRPKSAIDPPLSRSVFQNSAMLAASRAGEELLAWPEPRLVPSSTVEPRATFAHTLPSSPLCKVEPVTPTRQYHSSSILDSSPFPFDGSSSISHWEDEVQLEPPVELHEPELASPPRIDMSVLHKRQQPGRVKRVSAPSTKYDEVIPINHFKCGMCSKRFKRAEHRKRHEDTVCLRIKEPKHCWVVTGGKPCGRDFSRGDNLQSHLRKTHGRRSANQRNSYVATLDPASKYYDPEWTGQLTAEGLPIDHPKWPEVQV